MHEYIILGVCVCVFTMQMGIYSLLGLSWPGGQARPSEGQSGHTPVLLGGHVVRANGGG